MATPLLQFTSSGIYCQQADLYIDPWRPVKSAIITHAHSDHARAGMSAYLAHTDAASVLRLRLGADINLATLSYGQSIYVGGVRISLHPAGHIHGSAQVRLEYKGEVWVVSGDYKLESDGVCTPFEPVKCHHFVTESTFGLPVFRWQPQQTVFSQINRWWQQNKEAGKASVIYAYALGKAQRVIMNVDRSIGKIYVHGAVHNVNEALRADGLKLPPILPVVPEVAKDAYVGSLIIAPGSAAGSPWMRRFQPYEEADVSGWMAVRGIKRRRGGGTGFVLSDHADWQGLNSAIGLTGADHIYVTHGYKSVLARWLTDQGLHAVEVGTQYEGESQLRSSDTNPASDIATA